MGVAARKFEPQAGEAIPQNGPEAARLFIQNPYQFTKDMYDYRARNVRIEQLKMLNKMAQTGRLTVADVQNLTAYMRDLSGQEPVTYDRSPREGVYNFDVLYDGLNFLKSRGKKRPDFLPYLIADIFASLAKTEQGMELIEKAELFSDTEYPLFKMPSHDLRHMNRMVHSDFGAGNSMNYKDNWHYAWILGAIASQDAGMAFLRRTDFKIEQRSLFVLAHNDQAADLMIERAQSSEHLWKWYGNAVGQPNLIETLGQTKAGTKLIRALGVREMFLTMLAHGEKAEYMLREYGSREVYGAVSGLFALNGRAYSKSLITHQLRNTVRKALTVIARENKSEIALRHSDYERVESLLWSIDKTLKRRQQAKARKKARALKKG